MTTAEMYRVLGLEEGAGPEAVRQAYFRLIRKYPQETHPEKFQRLREAYEALRDGPPEEDDDFVVETMSSAVIDLLRTAKENAERGDYEAACRAMEDALRLHPDNPALHLLMAKFQMYAGHTQVAARHAEIVTELQPDNRIAWMILANALDNRGWYKKARKAFDRAYELGTRDWEFLISRIENRVHNESLESVSADDIIEVIRATPVNPGTYEVLQSSYYQWAQRVSPDPESVSDLLSDYERFISSISAKMEPDTQHMAPLLAFESENRAVALNPQNRKRMQTTLKKLLNKHLITQESVIDFNGNMILELVLNDQRLTQDAWLGMCLYDVANEKPELMSYHVADCQLALLENMNQTMQEADIIRSAYPELPEHYPEFFTALQNGGAEALIVQLRSRVKRLSRKYGDGMTGRQLAEASAKRIRNQLMDYPDSDEPDDWEDWDDEAYAPDHDYWMPDGMPEPEETFVRDRPTVGRNDPCPCGSGKKFKKCCMGKGIYD